MYLEINKHARIDNYLKYMPFRDKQNCSLYLLKLFFNITPFEFNLNMNTNNLNMNKRIIGFSISHCYETWLNYEYK